MLQGTVEGQPVAKPLQVVLHQRVGHGGGLAAQLAQEVPAQLVFLLRRDADSDAIAQAGQVAARIGGGGSGRRQGQQQGQ